MEESLWLNRGNYSDVGSESGGYSWQTTVGTGLELGIIIHSQGKTSVVPAGEPSGWIWRDQLGPVG